MSAVPGGGEAGKGETARLGAAEAQSRRSESRLARVLENISDAFFALDPEWRFTFLNREAEGFRHVARATADAIRDWDLRGCAVRRAPTRSSSPYR